MSARDDLPVFYGTPLLDDDDGELRLVTKQEIRQLSRPVRGAFTGGFSAGHYNTVSTLEGFSPQTFYSTKNQRASKFARQAPEDFMDEDDMSRYGIAPRRLTVRRERVESYVDEPAGAMVRSSMACKSERYCLAYELMNSKLGWKQGKGIGPAVKLRQKHLEGTYPEEFADSTVEPDVVDVVIPTEKTDQKGLGYVGLDSAAIAEKKGRKMPSRNHAFGVGVLNDSDEEDMYQAFGEDSMENYDFECGPSPVANELLAVTHGGGIMRFTLVERLESVRLDDSFGTVSFERKRRFDDAHFDSKRVSAVQLEWDKQCQPVDVSLKKDMKTGLANRFTSSGSSVIKVDIDDKKDVQVEAAQAQMMGKLTRRVNEWFADAKAYKLFNLNAPTENKSRIASAARTKTGIFDALNDSKPEMLQSPVVKQNLSEIVPATSESANLIEQLNQWRSQLGLKNEIAEVRPPVDLYKAIFGNDDADDEDFTETKPNLHQYYGPSTPPDLKFESCAVETSCWEPAQLGLDGQFVERGKQADQPDDKLKQRWEWAARSLGR